MQRVVVKPSVFAHLARQTRQGKLIGLDVSFSVVGVAVAEVEFGLASPLVVLKRNVFNEQAVYIKLKEILVAQGTIAGIVVGWPVNLGGKTDESCFTVKRFTDELLKQVTYPITYWDESGTSGMAKEWVGPKRKKRQLYDDVAATFILQSFLDKHLGSQTEDGA